ncbi:MAG TPA: CaiB/BaiF CoA-transferase family protein [Dongiaceae bacterium]|nr:CaiB/BaiF CoA-transferase family protein [Dongiaceae bacterium]
MTPLHGLKVLDLSRILAGPTATQILGDFGAEIIKIERPGQGDDTRGWGPPYVRNAQGEEISESTYYLASNRNKKSVAVDISKPEGSALVRRLIAKSDVVVENFKVGNLARYGLSYADLKAEFPHLIYCSITGFGQTGPYAKHAGYDFLVQGMGGIMSITGEPDGAPTKVGVAVADLMCGLYAVIGILAALHHRNESGEGQHVDLSLLDTQVASLSYLAINYLVAGVVPQRLGNEHPSIVPYSVVPCSDGHFILANGNDSQFERFCVFAGHPEWAKDPRFATNSARVKNRRICYALIEAVTRTKPQSYWIEGLTSVGVPVGPVNTIDQVFADPQVQARDMRIRMDYPLAGAGAIDLVANPLKFSKTPVRYDLPPPCCGEHTEEILGGQLGLSPQDLAGLRARGII